jgi:hypothetical protein
VPSGLGIAHCNLVLIGAGYRWPTMQVSTKTYFLMFNFSIKAR